MEKPEIEMIRIKSFQGFVKLMTTRSRTGWIFRGQEDATWQLLPSIDRHTINRLSARLFESELLREFRQRVRPFLPQEPFSEWEWLAIAQHHGLLTRLLDWTTNPMVGLYFAIEGARQETDSAVWCYKPRVWSRDHPQDPFDIYQVTIYEPPHISPRISPQCGLFTAHPPRFSETAGASHNWQRQLSKIEIPFGLREELRITLAGLGVHSASLFPGLDGIAHFLSHTWRPLAESSAVFVRAGDESYGESVRSLRDGRSGKIFFYNLNPVTGVLDCASVLWDERNKEDGSQSFESIEFLEELDFVGAGANGITTARRIPPPSR